MSVLKSVRFNLETATEEVPLTLFLSPTRSSRQAHPVDARVFLKKKTRAGVVVKHLEQIENDRRMLYFQDGPSPLLHPVCFMLNDEGGEANLQTVKVGDVIDNPQISMPKTLGEARILAQNILNATLIGTRIRLEPEADGHYQQWCTSKSVSPEKLSGVIVGVDIHPTFQLWIKCHRFPREPMTNAFWRWANLIDMDVPDEWSPDLWSHLAVQQYANDWFGLEQFLPEAFDLDSIRSWLEWHRPLPGNIFYEMPYPSHADPSVYKYYEFHQVNSDVPLPLALPGLVIPPETLDHDLVHVVLSGLPEMIQLRQQRQPLEVNINVKGRDGGQLFEYQREALDKLAVAQLHPVSIFMMGCGGGKTQIIWTICLHPLFNPDHRPQPILMACDRNEILQQTAHKLGDIQRLTGLSLEQLERLHDGSELAFSVDSGMLEEMEQVLAYFCKCRDEGHFVRWVDIEAYFGPGQRLYPLLMGRMATICVNTLRSREHFPWPFFRRFIGDEADRSIPARETRRVIQQGQQQHVPVTLISATGQKKMQEAFQVTEETALVVIPWRKLIAHGRLKQLKIRILLQYSIDEQGRRFFDYQTPKPEKQDPLHMTNFFKWAAQANLADRFACQDLPREQQPIMHFIVPNNANGRVNQVLETARQQADSVCEGPDKPAVVEVFNQKRRTGSAEQEEEKLEIALDKKTWDR